MDHSQRRLIPFTVIPQFPDYSIAVSQGGQVMVLNEKRQRPMSLALCPQSGLHVVYLRRDKKQTSVLIPRLVMMALGASLDGCRVEVIGRRHDYHPDNLRVVRVNKLSPEDAQQIRHLHIAQRHSVEELTKRFGVDPATVFRIVRYETWKHLPPGPAYPVPQEEKFPIHKLQEKHMYWGFMGRLLRASDKEFDRMLADLVSVEDTYAPNTVTYDDEDGDEDCMDSATADPIADKPSETPHSAFMRERSVRKAKERKAKRRAADGGS